MNTAAADPQGTAGPQAGAVRLGGSPAPACPCLASHGKRLPRVPDEPAHAARHTRDFLATLAHELRHPLAPLGYGLALLRLQCSDPATASQTLDMMERQLGQLARLVDDLLDTARIASGKLRFRPERVTLASILASALETSQPLIDAGRHALRVETDDEPLVLDADAPRLVQVLVNLLGNAARYTPQGGRIDVSARREGRQAVISVADNGVGMAGASIAGVFGMFSQAAPDSEAARDGLGIGLALVRQVVELHGGTASAASKGPGQGSTFVVRLPLAASDHEEAPATAATLLPGKPPGAPARGLRILVADDDAESARLLAAVFESHGCGHVVALAGNGLEAVALARQFKPEVAFLDLSMPGLDGCQAAQALRQDQGPHALVLVALTGWGDKRSRNRSAAAGFDHHLVKPVPQGAIDALFCALAADGA